MKEADTVLEEAFTIIRREGLEQLSEEELTERLNLSLQAFRQLFADKEDLLQKTIRHELEEQKKENAALLSQTSNPAEQIMLLLLNGLKKAELFHPSFFAQLQERHPAVWRLYQTHMQDYSFFLVYDILNRGVVEGVFRKDINLELVTRIIFEQINMLLNPRAFPTERYNLAEVFRSVYLYYIRGLCSDQGMPLADSFFAKNNL